MTPSEDAPKKRSVIFSRTAAKGYGKLPQHVRSACADLLRALASGMIQGHKLKGELEGLRSLRVGRGHRLVYRQTETEIQVIDIGPRGDVYKR